MDVIIAYTKSVVGQRYCVDQTSVDAAANRWERRALKLSSVAREALLKSHAVAFVKARASPISWSRGGPPAQLIGNSAVGANEVGNTVGQNDLQPIDGRRAEKGVALIDQVEQGSDDQRDMERAAQNAVGNRALACELPGQDCLGRQGD